MLWLLRHGDAAPGSPDEQRPLTDLGRTQARAAGLALARLEVPIELCLSSPKLRALKTAELACEELGVEVALTGELAGEPFDPQSVAAGLQDALLVGHEPSISSAVRELTGANVAIRKGGLAGIDGRELVVLMTPDQLLAMASVQGVA